jgi:adenylate cyclase
MVIMTDEIKPSPEIEAIVRRWLTSYGRRDADAVTNLFSESPALTYIGSAEDEFLTGDTLRQHFATYTEDVPDFVHFEDLITGFERGSVGWAIWTGGTRRPDTGKTARFRTTFILNLEKAVWRLIHVHNSNPVANIESMGYEPRSFDELIAAAEAATPTIPQSGMASVMFTDIADSTALAQALGDENWAQLVERHLDLVGDIIAKSGGNLVKSLGDGTMSTFTSAVAALSAAKLVQQAVAAEMAEPRLRTRIGLHTGDVVQAGGDFFGIVVNKAARVAALAAPEEIRVSEATRMMVGGSREFRFSDPATVPLKGLEGDHLVYRLDNGTGLGSTQLED